MKQHVQFGISALLIGALCSLASCSKDDFSELTGPVEEPSLDRKVEMRMAFAKTLAKAVTNEQVREELKRESAQYFNKDYDVLFARVKNNRLNARHTFYSYIDSVSRVEKVLDEATKKISLPLTLDEVTKDVPLLTVYVGTYLHSKDWDTKNEVPVVAVRDKQDRLIAFNEAGEQMELNPLEEPLAPIIVVKDNERVVAKGPRIQSPVAKTGDFILEDKGTKYYFLDNEYNGLVSNRQVSLSAPDAPDARMMEAYNISLNCSSCAQRDWIYYGINLSNGQTEGPVNYNYKEAITAMKFENLGGFNAVGGWDEGNFEFWINGFFGGTAPTLVPILKNLSALPEDLVEFHTERRRKSGVSGFFGGTYTVRVADNVKEYTFRTPTEFVPWDMQKYGDTWGMTIEEYDPTVNEKKTYSHTTVVGTNFEIKAGVPTKIGGTLGATTTDTKQYTTEYTSQTGNDVLGNALIPYRSPVITRAQPGYIWVIPNTAWTNELSSGSLVLSFETVRVLQ